MVGRPALQPMNLGPTSNIVNRRLTLRKPSLQGTPRAAMSDLGSIFDRGSGLCRPAHFRFVPKADVRSYEKLVVTGHERTHALQQKSLENLRRKRHSARRGG